MKALANLSPRRKEEIMGFLMLTLGVLLFFSLISHSLQDDVEITNNFSLKIFEVTADNWVGLLGAVISYLLYYLLGLLSYFLPVYAVLLGVRFLLRWKLPWLRKKVHYIAFICASVFLILSVDYISGGGYIDFGSTPGGAISIGIASFIIRFFGKLGAMILFFGATVIMVLLLIEWRPRGWDRQIAKVPSKVKAWILSLLGISKSGKKSAKSKTSAGKKNGFKPTIILTPFKAVASAISGLFKRNKTINKIDVHQKTSSIAEDNSKFTDLFESLDIENDDNKLNESSSSKDDNQKSEKEKMVLKLTRKAEDGYCFPELSILDDNPQPEKAISTAELNQVAQQLLDTLKTFNINIVDEKIEKYPGPIITRYEFKPAPGVKVNQVLNLSDDLALALRAKRIRIIAPVPGKAAIGVEIPNRFPQTVYLKDVLADKEFKLKKYILPMALGLTTSGKPFIADLSSMPHLLIAGATGSGKSVCMNVLISSLIYRHHPNNLRFIFVDPKMLELSVYSGIPHLERPVITKPKQAERALNDTVLEMENRYKILASQSVRNIVQYNNKVQASDRLPYIVVMVDELADLMMSQQSSRIELLLTRLAQMARAVGIHLILATQRPSVDVITGLIKANFSARIAFQVATRIDSRTILDGNGAEKLLGKGDMLFLEPGQAEPVRIHGAFISSDETSNLVDVLKEQKVNIKKIESMTEESVQKRTLVSDTDPLYKEAAEVVIRHKQGSVSLLQRRLGIGYQRAARLIDLLEAKGIVGPYDGSKAREVLADQSLLEQLKSN